MRLSHRYSRRDFMRVGALSALGLTLSDVLRLRAAANAKTALPRCILIWLDGGPSHLDTFDLKPDAPIEVRGPFKPADTKVPGIQICEYFKNLAGLKFTSNNLYEYQLCRAIGDGQFDLPFGYDEILLSALALGATGAVGSSFNFAAPIYQRVIKAWTAGDLATARM